MQELPSVLVATDLSPAAAPAARLAGALARALGGRVVVAHVVEISLKSWLGSRYDILVNAEKRAHLEASVQSWFEQATGTPPAAVDLRVNSCDRGLSEAVGAHHGAVLVMAATGKGALTRVVVGSRVQDVASHPPCPLLIATSEALPRRVAVATDFSEGAERAVAAAARLARQIRAELLVVHVAEIPESPELEASLFQGSFEAFFAEEEARLRAVAQAAQVEGGAQPIMLRGRAEDALTQLVAERGVDLLVVGQTGHDSPLGDLLGSVPRSLIGRMPCSIYVVPTGAPQ